MTAFVTATVTPASLYLSVTCWQLCSPIQNDRVCDRDRDTCACPPTYKAVHTSPAGSFARLFRMTVFVTATVTPARVHPPTRLCTLSVSHLYDIVPLSHLLAALLAYSE
ncbi:hypothetical protein J6590_024645 [Homalodisca vitripennis]|nr:hypothetical protein J6590_024645 [Homalodisca vitripennis]